MRHTGLRTRGLAWRSRKVNGAFGWRVLAVLLLSISFLPAIPRPVRAASDAYVSTDALYLRSDPSSEAPVLDEMAFGAYLTVIDGPTEDGWYFVDFDGSQGWAFGDYLSFGSPPADVGASYVGTGDMGSGQAWVDADALNVRAEADAGAAVIETLGQGASLAIIGEPVAGYYPVDVDGGTGWVAGQFLSWSPVAAGPERWISVDRSSWTISLMVGDTTIATYLAAMGFDDSADGFYATALGTYYVYVMNASLTYTSFAKGYIEYWIGFDESRENGFHSWLMDANGYLIEGGGDPTGGCVALEPDLAAQVYEFASYGMRVEVHW